MLSVGTISRLQVDAYDTSQAKEQSRYFLTIQPVHFLPAAHKIEVEFPTTGNYITLNSGPCSITQATGALIIGEAQCSIEGNSVVVSNTFGATGSFSKGDAAFGFLFDSGGINPERTCGSMHFTVRTFATIDGVDYSVDYYSFNSIVDVPPRFLAF